MFSTSPTFRLAYLLPVCAALFAEGCATQKEGPHAVADLKPASGSQTTGTVWLAQEADQVVVRVRVSGLVPNQEHGFHAHEKGDCSSPDATSAGAHFNPNAKPHGPQSADHHAGDMPALKADGAGVAQTTFAVKGTVFGAGASDLVGKAFIVHEKADDYTTQPTGNSGKRIACGVITLSGAPGAASQY